FRYCCQYFSFFFFQAEDGIRDGHVTGVQTCALPILILLSHASNSGFADALPAVAVGSAVAVNGATSPPRPKAAALAAMRPRKPRRGVVKWPTSNMRPPIKWER